MIGRRDAKSRHRKCLFLCVISRVLAQASCELCEPRNTRKNEGNIFVNVEINDMVCGVFETGHHGHLGVHTNRLIEKCLKDSKCVDLEALCIISEEQVICYLNNFESREYLNRNDSFMINIFEFCLRPGKSELTLRF